MALALFALRHFAGDMLPDPAPARLGVEVLIGGATYALTLLAISPSTAREVLALVPTRRAARAG